jgi:tetratricopeptide (TPR) repeat protein/TolB-like protein
MIKTISSAIDSRPSAGLGAGPDRLDSWKEIASYFKREVRTVQLWEKKEGLPVHRHFHKQLGSVFAFRSEIEEWGQQVSRRGLNADPNAQGLTTGLTTAPRATAVEERVMIRMLPLQNASLDGRYQTLCEAIAAKTIPALERLNPDHLGILCSTAATQDGPASAKTKDAETKGEETKADYVLTWTLQEEGDGLAVKVSLLLAEAELPTWSRTFHCHHDDCEGTSSYIADQIVQCLWLKVISSPTSSQISGRREQSGSREGYLRGRYFWSQRSEESLRKAVQCFEAAIRDEPTFALPYSGLADSFTLLSFYEFVSPSEAMPAARRAALKAIELDPDLAEAHASLADVLLHFDRDWQGADREYRRAIQCNPTYALGYHWYANLLAARGQHEAAHIAIMHALDIDPVSPITLVWAGFTSHLAHRFDEAIRHYQNALELKPDLVWAHMYMAQALEQEGSYKEALREFETTIKLTGGSNCVEAMKAHALAAAGDKSSARQILSQLKRTPTNKCMPSYDIAATYAALGDVKQTVQWLNRACHERNMKLFTLVQDPRFDLLRSRSEFMQIVDQMGLTQYNPAHRLPIS